MATRFGGFTPQQQQVLLSLAGYQGPAQQDDLNKFMMASPKAAAMMGRYTEMAKARVQGGPQIAMQVGGLTAEEQMEKFNQAQQTASFLNNTMSGNYTKPTEDFGKPLQATATPSAAGNIEAFNQQQQQAMDQMNSNPDQYAQIKQQQEEFQNSPVMVAAREAQEKIKQQAFQQAGLSGPPTNQQEAARVNEILETLVANSPEIKAAQTAQQNFMSTLNHLLPGYTMPIDTVPIDTRGGGPVPLPVEGIDDGIPPVQQPDSGGYDPSTGLPTSPSTEGLNTALQNVTGVSPDTKTGFDALVKTGNLPEDPTKYTITGKAEDWTVTFDNGATMKINVAQESKARERIAQQVTPALEQVKASPEYQQYKGSLDKYKEELDQYKSYYSEQSVVSPEETSAQLDEAQANLSKEQNLINEYTRQLAAMEPDDPQREVIQGLIDEQQVKITNAQAQLKQAQTNIERVGMPSTTEMRKTALEDPTSMVETADVAKVTEAQRAAGKMAEGTGQAPTSATGAGLVTAAIEGDVPLAKEFEAKGYTADQAAQEVIDVMSKLEAATGKPSDQALAEAATMNPQELAQLGLTVDQIENAQRVEEVAPLVFTPDMEVSATVDYERAKVETNFAAATGVPSTEATVQGQLTQLMEQFEGGETPAWASGAIRAATQRMAARGLSASSMAGQAIVQAAMESALPIAQMDAQTRAQFEAQNLSNRQQAAMFAAEQRAKFLGMEFDQQFQARVQNAARIADIAQINFTAEQQVALENARMAQTVDIANLDAKNAKVMADAAAMTQLDLANLNNRQQANVQRAQAFLDFDMASLNNLQQVAMFKAQSLANVYTSDAAAENAARQFNAASEDQVNMFMANLQSSIQQFNVDQKNSMERFNAGEANALAQFNAAQQNARDQFNASNALIVEQANAKWEQDITTMETTAQNQANRDAAIAANNLTETTYNNMLQQERDALDYAWRSAESAADRENALLIAEMQTQAEVDRARGEGTGTLLNTVVEVVAMKALGVR